MVLKKKQTLITLVRHRISQEIFDYQVLMDALREFRKPRDAIQRLVASGDILRIRKGVYSFAVPLRRQAISREQLANLLYGPSYVSLDYALSLHGLIPERVETLTSVTTGRSRQFETPFGPFSYQMLPAGRYASGMQFWPGEAPTFLLASPEKALADKVWMDKRFPGTTVGEFGPYLLEDLRMAPEVLTELDFDRLDAIVAAYTSRKIDNLRQYLLRLKRGMANE